MTCELTDSRGKEKRKKKKKIKKGIWKKKIGIKLEGRNSQINASRKEMRNDREKSANLIRSPFGHVA